MSEFVIDDWKLKARTVVKLYRKNTNTFVSCGYRSPFRHAPFRLRPNWVKVRFNVPNSYDVIK